MKNESNDQVPNVNEVVVPNVNEVVELDPPRQNADSVPGHPVSINL